MRFPNSATVATLAMLGVAPASAQFSGDWSTLIRTRDITGGPVYTTNEAYDEGSWAADGGEYLWGDSGYDSIGVDWNQIGTIEDVVLDNTGKLRGVVVEVGGFLDLGDQHVFLEVGAVDLLPADDEEYAMITRFSEEELEDMEGVDEAWWE